MLMNRRIMRRLEQWHVLAPSQFGFRSGREVVDACSRLAEDIVAAFRRREVVQAVTLDIQSAYDTVWREGLIRKLEVIGMDPYIIAWIYSFLSGRCCSLEVGGSTSEVAPECGLPQGSPLSPTLFLVYIDDLLHALQRVRKLRSQGFADDLAVWIAGELRSGDTEPTLRRGLQVVEDWSRRWRIRFSPQKCICVCFRGKNVRVMREFEVRLHDEPLPHSRAVRYLGVWFDEHLSWNKHLSEVISRARARLWQLLRTVRSEWGLTPDLFMRLVRGAVLPGLFFGAPVWASVLRYNTHLTELDGILALAARMAYGLERFTSMEASLALAGLMPARQQILQRLTGYMLRRRRAVLVEDDQELATHRSYVTPTELGRTWFQRQMRGQTLTYSLPRQKRLILKGIQRALLNEWQRRWTCTEMGRQLFDVMGRVGGGWLPRDALVVRREDWTKVARFLMGHYHLGDWSPSRDSEVDERCPLCLEAFSREHLIWDCERLEAVRRATLGRFSDRERWNLARLIWVGSGPLGRFLRGAHEVVGRLHKESLLSEDVV